MTRTVALFSLGVVFLGVAAGWFFMMRGEGDRFAGCRKASIAGGSASIGGPFTLVNGDGETVTDADVITKPTLVYFGYTFCPDFCPTDMGRNAAVLDLLAGRGIDTGLVFVSVDPVRDTPEMVDDFATSLHPEAVGLTGTAEAVSEAAAQYKVYYRKSGDDPEYYLMDHSTFTYLMAPGEGFLEFYSSDTGVEDLADSVRCFVQAL